MSQLISDGKVEVQEGARRLIQDASLTIKDLWGAIIELVTNSDDAYQRLSSMGTIVIEIIRRAGSGQPTTLKVRDFAGGMTLKTMREKLKYTGGRESGMQEGLSVRGTNSRGAKDISALGKVTFESLATDGTYNKCMISTHLDFYYADPVKITESHRKELGIPKGTGTVVTLEMDSTVRIPRSADLSKKLSLLVALRDILSDKKREVLLKDGRGSAVPIQAPILAGKERLKETFKVPGYDGAKAKLTIKRTSEVLGNEKQRFRRGGILIKSRHGIHETTLFESSLESDPHASPFFGRLVCEYIDDLCNDYDQRVEDKIGHDPANPMPVLDPSRRSGLTREHPFVRALWAEVLKRLRPLVEEERQRAEKERVTVESVHTRKRLNGLEKAASAFMERQGRDPDSIRDTDGTQGKAFGQRGYTLSPPFGQLVQGHSIRCTLNINQKVFPEIESGTSVQVECSDKEIGTNRRFAPLEPHPTREGVLRATWKLSGLAPTAAAEMRVSVAATIKTECTVEVLESEADKYKDVKGLEFRRNRLRLKLGAGRKKVQLLAPTTMVGDPTVIQVSVDNSRFKISGDQTLWPRLELGVAICDLTVTVTGKEEATGVITARMGDDEVTASLAAIQPLGAGIKIKLEDIGEDYSQRYRWRQNLLEIAAFHPALKRYLGPSPKFDGQHRDHFRVVLAEVIAEAVCSRIVSDNARDNPEDYEEADFDRFYAEYTSHLAEFLPEAHKLQLPSVG
tara:strand:+ start:4183 stop:6396 length:2214 start_codon:yes stop_codon:yes gene_type:complete